MKKVMYYYSVMKSLEAILCESGINVNDINRNDYENLREKMQSAVSRLLKPGGNVGYQWPVSMTISRGGFGQTIETMRRPV